MHQNCLTLCLFGTFITPFGSDYISVYYEQYGIWVALRVDIKSGTFTKPMCWSTGVLSDH